MKKKAKRPKSKTTPTRGAPIPINRRIKNEPRDTMPTKRTILTRVPERQDIPTED